MNKKEYGFTLIELLVVISIIGILASVILIASTNARNKTKDARVLSDVKQARDTIQIGFANPIYSDLYYTNSGVATTNAVGSITSNGPGNNSLATLVQNDITLQGSTITYRIDTNTVSGDATHANAIAYAIYGRLITDTTKYFCMDSLGKSNPATTTTSYSVCG